ncbi:hypothetical protein KO481_34985 [Nocardia sp. NEAU-G5]|uniref:Uncharacterized protein n=1 Tax=Nocardia albiluteola TaxID=2842303 RepID=A0ABS6B8S2_9NOCA|nr:hypothetical protein [Nocardia albiluteola]MBU3066709.1 hypothetical protein [Nocardia albiluteola]
MLPLSAGVETTAASYGNLGGVDTTQTPWHGHPHSAPITLPPNTAVWLAAPPPPRDFSVVAWARVADHDRLPQHPALGVTRDDWRRKWELMRAGCPDMQITTEHRVENSEWVANDAAERDGHHLPGEGGAADLRLSHR